VLESAPTVNMRIVAPTCFNGPRITMQYCKQMTIRFRFCYKKF
jgi:hypothetical protein